MELWRIGIVLFVDTITFIRTKYMYLRHCTPILLFIQLFSQIHMIIIHQVIMTVSFFYWTVNIWRKSCPLFSVKRKRMWTGVVKLQKKKKIHKGIIKVDQITIHYILKSNSFVWQTDTNLSQQQLVLHIKPSYKNMVHMDYFYSKALL